MTSSRQFRKLYRAASRDAFRRILLIAGRQAKGVDRNRYRTFSLGVFVPPNPTLGRDLGLVGNGNQAG